MTIKLSALVRALAAKGMSADDIADVLEAAEQGAGAPDPKQAKALATLERRRAYDRDRKAAEAHRPANSTGNSTGKSAESATDPQNHSTGNSTGNAPISTGNDDRAPAHVGDISPTSEITCSASAALVSSDQIPPEIPPTDWPPGNTGDWRAALIAAAGPGLADPAKEPGLVTTQAEIGRWRRAGCSWPDDVLPVVTARTAKARASPIRGWSLFTPDILAAKQRREAPDPAPSEARNGHPAGHPAPSAKLAAKEANLRRSLAGFEAAVDRRRSGGSG